MPPHSSQAMSELIIVHQSCRDSRRLARVHLAQSGIKKRIQRQRKRSNSGPLPPDANATAAPRIPAQIALSGSSMVEYLISTNVFNELSSTWGVSPAVCPGPANLSHSLSRASDALECIFRANLAFHWVDLNLWMTADGKRDMRIAALSYRGQAIDLARKELIRYNTPQSTGRRMSRLSIHQANREMSFGIVLRLLQLDYRFARSDVHAHFAACRRLLRGYLTDNILGHQCPIDDLACVIRNPHLHHLMITFECVNCVPESIIWDDGDLAFLHSRLYELVSRLDMCNTVSTNNRSVHGFSPPAPPRVSPFTILWRILTKQPALIASNIYHDVCESSAQLAALLILCSVFLDYEDGLEVADASVPDQCVEDLESALLALGEEDALSSALNAAWLLAGGLGLPLARRRARLWSVSGMVYALKRSTYPNTTAVECDAVDQKLECLYVKQVCLAYLANPGKVSPTNRHTVNHSTFPYHPICQDPLDPS